MFLSSLLLSIFILFQLIIPPIPDPPYESIPDPQGRFIEQLEFDRYILLLMEQNENPPFERPS
jgi:hypothetical protein